MKALEIKYTGQGSEKQVAWATDIFNKEIGKIQQAYEHAKFRVQDGTMPEKWVATWELILNDTRIVKAIESFAKQSASDTISYKGFKSRVGSISIAAHVEKIVLDTYQA